MVIAKKPNFDEILPAVRVTKVMADDVELYCEATGVNYGQLVRKALTQYLYKSKALKTAKTKNPGGQ